MGKEVYKKDYISGYSTWKSLYTSRNDSFIAEMTYAILSYETKIKFVNDSIIYCVPISKTPKILDYYEVNYHVLCNIDSLEKILFDISDNKDIHRFFLTRHYKEIKYDNYDQDRLTIHINKHSDRIKNVDKILSEVLSLIETINVRAHNKETNDHIVCHVDTLYKAIKSKGAASYKQFSDKSRAAGLWLYDRCLIEPELSQSAAIREFRDTFDMEKLGFEDTSDTVFQRYIRRTKACIDACEVLTMRDPKKPKAASKE